MATGLVGKQNDHFNFQDAKNVVRHQSNQIVYSRLKLLFENFYFRYLPYL